MVGSEVSPDEISQCNCCLLAPGGHILKKRGGARKETIMDVLEAQPPPSVILQWPHPRKKTVYNKAGDQTAVGTYDWR